MAQGDASRLVRKLWQYCSVLRDDGLSYPDYVEQLTYLLFLKMADEQADSPVPVGQDWASFAHLDADAMHARYGAALAALGQHGGMLGLIFRNAKNKIRDPAKLRLLVVDLVGQSDWSGLSPDVKGDAYEGLLEKNARDTKSGAGQYFTPRPLIDAIVACVAPRPGEVICDPACGTGGFLLAAHGYVSHAHRALTSAQTLHLRSSAIRGVELVEEVARLATMNLVLHGIGSPTDTDLPVVCADSLAAPPRSKVDVVLTNPPFGIKGSVSYPRKGSSGKRAENLTIVRPDFWAQTANKQLNFVQHVAAILSPGGRAAMVLPDNVLYEGGAGTTIRRQFLEVCDVHTLLRLPTGIFYAQGVQANVLFFDRRPDSPTRGPELSRLWVYDLRSQLRLSLKTNPLTDAHLEEFVRLYLPGAPHLRIDTPPTVGGVDRWKSFAVADILRTPDCNLDLSWAVDQERRVGGVARLDEISAAIATDLQRAMSHLQAIGRPPK